MADTLFTGRDPPARRLHRVGSGTISAIEILVLGLLAAYVVLLAIPSAFEIQSQCVGQYGTQHIAGDSYFAAASVSGTLGWLAVALGALFAQISESPRIAMLLPLAWFILFVSIFGIVAVAISPQLCPL